MEPQTERAGAGAEEEEPRTLVSKVHACLCSHGSAPACRPNSIRLASGHASAIRQETSFERTAEVFCYALLAPAMLAPRMRSSQIHVDLHPPVLLL